MDLDLLEEEFDSLFINNKFAQLPFDQKENAMRITAARFAEKNDARDEASIRDISQVLSDANTRLRQGLRTGRYVPTEEQTSRIFGKIGIDFEGATKKGKLKQLEDSRDAIKDAALSDPELSLYANDADFVLNEHITQARRQVKGERYTGFTGGVKSAADNIAQGALSRVVRTFGGSDEGIRDFFAENPEFDDDFVQKLASGVGDVGATVGMIFASSIATGGIGGAAGLTGTALKTAKGAAAFTTSTMSNAVVRYREAYDNEIVFSGDKDRAQKSGIDNLPAAAIDTIGDILLTKALIPKAWSGLGTLADKKAFLKAQLTKKNMAQRVAGSFIAQGTSEIAGDYSSGQLQYLSTGNEDVIPDSSELIDSFLIGGIIGAGGGAIGATVGGVSASNELAKIEADGSVSPEPKIEGDQDDAKTKERKQELQQVRTQQRTGEEEESTTVLGKTPDEQGQGQEGLAREKLIADQVALGLPDRPLTDQEFDSERLVLLEAIAKKSDNVDELQKRSDAARQLRAIDEIELAESQAAIIKGVTDVKFDTPEAAQSVVDLVNPQVEKDGIQLKVEERNGEHIIMSEISDTALQSRIAKTSTTEETGITERDLIQQFGTLRVREEGFSSRDDAIDFMNEYAEEQNIDPKTVQVVLATDGKFYVENTKFQFGTQEEAGAAADQINDADNLREAKVVPSGSNFSLKVTSTERASEIKDAEHQARNLEKFEELGIIVPATGITSQDLNNQIDAIFNIDGKPAREQGQASKAMSDAINFAEQELGTTFEQEVHEAMGTEQARRVRDAIETSPEESLADDIQEGFSTNLRSRLNEAGFVDLDAIVSTAADTFRSGVANLADFTKALVSKFGNAIKQFAKDLYNAALDAGHNIMLKALQRTGGIAFAQDPSQQKTFEFKDGKVVPVTAQPAATEAKPEAKKATAKKIDKAEAEDRANQITKLKNTSRKKLRTSEDKKVHDFLKQVMLPNLAALNKHNPDAARLVHGLIFNFNESRVGKRERVPSFELFGKVKDLPADLQKVFIADGIDLESNQAEALAAYGDRAYVVQKVNRYINTPGIQEEQKALKVENGQLSLDAQGNTIETGEIQPGLQDAFEKGFFEPDDTFTGKDKINSYLLRNPVIQDVRSKTAAKSKAKRDEDRKIIMEFIAVLQPEAQKLGPKDSVFSDGFKVKDNDTVLALAIKHLQSFDPEVLEDQDLMNHAVALDEFVNDRTLSLAAPAIDALAEQLLSKQEILGLIGKFRNSASKSFGSRLTNIFEGISPTPQKLERLSAFQDGKNFLKALYQPLVNAGSNFDFQRDALEKDLNKITKKWFGGKLTQEQNIRMGLAGQLLSYRANQDPAKEFRQVVESRRKSIELALVSGAKKSQRFHAIAQTELNSLLADVDFELEDGFAKNAHDGVTGRLTDAERGWLTDQVDLMSGWRDDMKFVTEAIRGYPFQEIVNYFRTSQIPVDQSLEGSLNEVESALDSAEYGVLQQNAGMFTAPSLMMRPSSSKNQTRHLRDGHIYILSATTLANQSARMTAFEATTAVARKITTRLLQNQEVADAVNSNGKLPENPRRIKLVQKWFAEEVLNMASQASFAGDAHRFINAWAKTVGVFTLGKVHRFVSEYLSSSLHYNIEHFGDANRMKFYAESNLHILSEKFKPILDAGNIRNRAAMSEELLRDQNFKPTGFGKAGNKFFDYTDSVTKIIGTPLRVGDQMSARTVFLAEYVAHEYERGAAPNGFASIDPNNINEESLAAASIATDLIVAPSRPASRGIFFQNHNKAVAAGRNALMSFTSHGAAMVTQVATAARDYSYFVSQGQPLSADARKSLKRIAGILAQSVGFTLGRATPALVLMMVLKAAYRDADDDEYITDLREDLAQKKGNPRKTEEDKVAIKDLEDELQFMQQTRDHLRQTERKIASSESLFKRFFKDATGNIFMPATFFPGAVDALSLIAIDKFADPVFAAAKKEMKEDLLEQAKIAKADKNFRAEGRIRQAIEDLEGAERIKVGREEFGAPKVLPGIFGIGIDSLVRSGSEAAAAAAQTDEFDYNDFILAMGAFGMGQGDLSDGLRFADKVQDSAVRLARDKAESKKKADEKALQEKKIRDERARKISSMFNLTP